MQAGLSLSQVLMLVSFAGLLAIGQILFKHVALAMNGDHLPSLAIQFLVNPVAWSALVLYGLATAAWVLILRSVPLSIAYPFAALGFVIVPVAAHFMFNEPLGLKYALGTGCIILGLYLISNS